MLVIIPFCTKITVFSVCFCRKHGLSDDTVDFIGHALALHRDDRHLDEPALDTVKRMKVSLDKSSGRWSLFGIISLSCTPSVPQYKMFLQAKTTCKNVLYYGMEGVAVILTMTSSPT